MAVHVLFVDCSTSLRFHLALLVGNGERRDPHLPRSTDSLRPHSQDCYAPLIWRFSDRAKPILASFKNRKLRATGMAGNNAAIFHFVDPIAGFRDDRVVRGQEQSLPALLHDVL